MTLSSDETFMADISGAQVHDYILSCDLHVTA